MLLRPIHQRLLPVVRGMVKNEHDAEDLVQRTLETIYVKMNTFRGDSSLYTYAWRVAQSLALKELRDGTLHRKLLRKHTPTDTGVWSPGMGTSSHTPEKLAADREALSMFAVLSVKDQATIWNVLEEEDDGRPHSSTERSEIRRARL